MKSTSKKSGFWLAPVILAGSVVPTTAFAEGRWQFEVTPYIWFMGIDADVEVRGRPAKVDFDAGDVLDAADFGGSLLGIAQRNRLVLYGQVDYLSMDSDNLDDSPQNGSLTADTVMSTLAVGYQFDGFRRDQTIDVLVGVRYTAVDLELQLDSVGTFENDYSVTDPLVIVRPSFDLSDRWRFNPTLAFGGGGDSDTVYELQPQFQFQATERVAIRFGYRTVQYDIDGSNGNSFDGGFEGAVLGVGMVW